MSLLDSPQRPPFAFVRRARWRDGRPVQASLSPQLDLFGGRFRRQIFVESSRVCSGNGTLRELTHDDALLPSEGTTDLQFVSWSNEAIGLGGLTVDVHFTCPAVALGLGAGPEQARDIEPDIETNGRNRSVARVLVAHSLDETLRVSQN